jgi:hypothetical protein
MCGNVKDFTATPRPGHQGYRILRGGAFSEGGLTCHLAVQLYCRLEALSSNYGFRLAYTPPGIAPAEKK